MQSLGQCAVPAINAIALGILFDDILATCPDVSRSSFHIYCNVGRFDPKVSNLLPFV